MIISVFIPCSVICCDVSEEHASVFRGDRIWFKWKLKCMGEESISIIQERFKNLPIPICRTGRGDRTCIKPTGVESSKWTKAPNGGNHERYICEVSFWGVGVINFIVALTYGNVAADRYNCSVFGEVLRYSLFQGMCVRLAWTVKGKSFFLLYIVRDLLGLYCVPY